MKLQKLVSLAILIIVSIAGISFMQYAYPLHSKTRSRNCCEKDCKESKQSLDNSDNIFSSPVNRLIVAFHN